MPGRVAEHVVRTRRFGRKVRLRVDLHGVSVFGPGDRRSLIRWEWVESVSAGRGVVVRAANTEIALPPRAFGLEPETLARALREAQALDRRSDVIAALAGGETGR